MDDTAVARLDRAAARLAALRPQVLAGAPWPLADHFGTEPEAAWGPPEVLAHVAEMLGYWRGEVERIMDAAEQPVPFGRIADDPVRIGIIGRDRTLPLAFLFERIEVGVRAWRARLAELGEQDLARRGVHSRLGEMSVRALVEGFVVGHLEDHVDQLVTALGDRTD